MKYTNLPHLNISVTILQLCSKEVLLLAYCNNQNLICNNNKVIGNNNKIIGLPRTSSDDNSTPVTTRCTFFILENHFTITDHNKTVHSQ